jgi:fructan beta-fructosidase
MDPLKKADFRDPKIFYNDDAKEWMMVVAGGPLRFFSSTDLKNWKAEGMQSEITTECPDMYKLQVGDTGKYKWVLSEGGRYYRVGDFKIVDGVWKFVPDNNEHLTMNFAPDAYAAQTYYGTGTNGTPDGRRIMIQWMNNWSYAGSIGKITQTFNGQFTLQNEMKLINTADGIRLTQQPIKEYENLRQSPATFNNVTISPNSPNIMSNLSGSQYEIVSEFAPDANTTEVGFKLRVGKEVNQETVVKYNTKTGEVTIDRSKSGKAPSSSFKDPAIGKVTKTADGKIQLHIFVDASSVEVYANDGEITGTTEIFPNRSSQGIEVYSVGGNTQATIQYYPLSGIWNNNVKGTNSVELSLSESNFSKEIGEQFSIYTATIPTTAAQGVTWTISDPSVVKIISQDDAKTTFEVTAKGNTDLTATSKDGRSKKTASLGVYNRNITSDISDLTDFQGTTGNWFVNNNAYTSDALGIGDGFVTSAHMNNDLTATYTYEADAKFLTGDVAALVLYSETRDASKGSIVANILKDGSYRVFNFPGGQNVACNDATHPKIPVDPNGKYHLKAVIKGTHIQYWINGIQVCDADQSYYDTPGYFGLNTCNAKVEYTNIRLNKTGVDTSTLGIVKTEYEKNLGDEFTVYTNQDVNYKFNDDASLKVIKVSDGTDSTKTKFKVIGIGKANITAMPTSGNAQPVNITVTSYETNPDGKGIIEGLSGFTTSGGGRWYVNGDAYIAEGGGDKFAISNTSIEAKDGDNYTFETDATVLNPDDSCAPSLVLFSKSKDKPNDGALVFNVNPKEANWRIFEFGGSYGASGSITPSADGKYNMKVDIVGQTVKYYLNGTEVCSTPDFTQRSGYVGLMSWNANVEFRNTVFKSGNDITVTTGAAVTVTTGAAITVAAPVTGEIPVSTISNTKEYTAIITWSETPVIFEAKKVYTATITIKPKAGYTVIGVPKDYFKVGGATATNNADSGVITAVFPATN